MINNRQGGRRRGRGGGQRNQGGQGQRDSGNRIDSRARGNASQLHEKYKSMAADAQRQGDRVNTEYYLQFADHYFRVMTDQRGRYEEQNPQARRQVPDYDFDGEEEYGDEGESVRADENREAAREQNREDGNREYGRDGNRDAGREGNREYGRDGNREQGRDYGRDGGREGRDANRDGNRRPQGEQRSGQRRDDRGYDAQTSAPQPRRDDRPAPAPVPSPVPSYANDEGDVVAAAASEQPAPKRRGRPRKQPEALPMGLEGEPALDHGALPPAIGPVSAPAEDAPKPRRRRASSAAGEASAG